MKKQVVLFCMILCVALVANISSAPAQDAEDPYVIIVEFTFDEKDVDKAIDLLLDMQTQTLENEEGCLIYDVLLSEDDPSRIFIYESYENEVAFKVHESSDYFKTIVSKQLTPLVKESKVTKVVPLSQEESFIDEEV
ncbi:MAG: antibiotic biosynthesis monooxygenase [Proteiniphilum sp.]|nr:antibiotic biosynthesis monooxygenase [Proteiniphilum sp.]